MLHQHDIPLSCPWSGTVQNGSQEAVSGCNVGCTFRLNVSVLCYMHYDVKYTVGIQNIRERCVVELEECTSKN